MSDYTDADGKAIETWVGVTNFTGFQTKLDATKVDDGANVNGQNTTINDGDRISNREIGYELFPQTATLSTAATPITSFHNFRKRDGTNIMMRSYGTVLEYFNPVSLTWITLKTGLTSGKKFGYADYNINTDLHSYTYFGNGYDSAMRWGGSYTKFSSASASTGSLGAIRLAFGGDGYAVGDIITLAGGTGGEAQVIALAEGAVNAVSISTAGTGYVVGETYVINQAGRDKPCEVTIATAGGGGTVTSVTINKSGAGYLVSGQGYTLTQTSGGAGDDAEIKITGTTDESIKYANITQVGLEHTAPGAGYSVADGVATTSAGSGTGALVDVTSVEDFSITTQDSYLSDEGFDTTGGRFILNAVEYAYKSISNGILLGLSADPTAIGASDGDVITGGVEMYTDHPKGNLYLVSSNRLFIGNVTNVNQAIYFSAYGDATDFLSASLVTDSTSTSPGIFNLGEGGGAVIGLTQDEKSIYAIKRSIIYAITLTDALYTLQALKPFDGKSQTTGGVNNQSCFAGNNGIFFITPDNQILKLSRLIGVDYPQSSSISNIIQPTVDTLFFENSSGIVFKDKAFFACKSDSDLGNNDTVLTWKTIQKPNTKEIAEFWDSPITGWPVADFVVYNNGTKDDLYFSDGVSPNVYKVIDKPIDDIYDVKSSWKSKKFTFGKPEDLKQITNAFIEGYIAPQTTLTINLYLGDEGSEHFFSTTLTGTETDYIINTTIDNKFGLTPFGTERFGSNDDSSGKKKFRIYLGKDVRINPAYNAQIEFISEGQNRQWEVTYFALKVSKFTQPIDRKLYKAFK